MMNCSGCGEPIEPMTKYLCVYMTKDGFNLVVGCGHYVPPEQFDYVFGGANCFHGWIREFEDSLRTCKHEGALQ